MPGSYPFLSKDGVVVESGVFDRKVTIQEISTTPDGAGGQVNTWVDILTTWAHIEPWRGKEYFRDMQLYPTVLDRVLIRWRPSLNLSAGMRVKYGTRYLRVRSVYPLAEARKVIELLTEELQATGSSH